MAKPKNRWVRQMDSEQEAAAGKSKAEKPKPLCKKCGVNRLENLKEIQAEICDSCRVQPQAPQPKEKTPLGLWDAD